jgi:adenine-specific DNA glycosylase
MAAALILFRERVAVVKLEADANRWGGMWQFPNVELEARETANAGAERAGRTLAGIDAQAKASLPSVKHAVTRFRITLEAVCCVASAGKTSAGVGVERVVWKRADELSEIAMPAAHRRLARSLETWLAQADVRKARKRSAGS